jgi:hypothetical protein
MKKTILLSICTLFLGLTLQAQATKATPDKKETEKKAMPSPPATAAGKIGKTAVTINYFQPAVKGRAIWGSLVPYDKVWRTGANNATVIEFDKDVKIEGKALKAGKYAIFTIPTATDMTFIFNKKTDQWGAYQYSDKEDVLRVKVKSAKAATFAERMTFDIKDKMVQLTWENVTAGFGVE